MLMLIMMLWMMVMMVVVDEDDEVDNVHGYDDNYQQDNDVLNGDVYDA